MLRPRGVLAAALAGLLPAGAASAAPPGRLFPAFGVTPGGLVWAVGLASRTIVLRDPDGTRRAAYPVAPDEGHVLGVADDGSRVTSRTPGGLARSRDLERVVSVTFRAPGGAVRSVREVGRLDRWAAAALGDSVFVARRDGALRLVDRVSADGESRVGAIPAGPLEEAIGRPGSPELHATPDGVVAVFEGRGRAFVRLDRPGEPIALDPDEACGVPRQDRAVVPSGRGVLRLFLRPSVASGSEPALPSAVAEVLDDRGAVAATSELGPFVAALALPGGGLLLLDGHEAVRVDGRLVPGPAVPFPLDPDEDPAWAADLAAAVRRLRALGRAATGEDWAALAALGGDLHREFLEAALRDPDGAARGLSLVPDGADGVRAARSALHDLLIAVRERGAPEAARLASALEAAALDRAPAWLSGVAGIALLAERREEAPAWARAAAAGALADAAGEDLGALLPAEVVTLDLAEVVAAVDRARIDAIERDRPDVASAARAGLPFPEGSEEVAAGLRFRIPAERYPRTLLACAEGPPSLRARLVLDRLTERAGEGGDGRADGEVASALLEAQQAADPGLAAVAHALGPFFGLPVDPARFRRLVLGRQDLAFHALSGLLADRSLPPQTFLALLLELLERARRATSDPWRCSLLVLGERDERRDEVYCQLFSLARSLGDGAAESFFGLSSERRELLRDWVRSSGAPPEIRLDAALHRALAGQASEDEVLDLWRSPDVPARLSRVALARRSKGPAPRLAAALERELASGRGSFEDRSAILAALEAVAPHAAAAAAAAAWKGGGVPADADGPYASAWVRSLDGAEVASDRALREALRPAERSEAFALDAALLLARALEPGAAERLARELFRSCRSCLGADELTSAFGGLGPEGADALASLATRLPRAETEALEALFSLAPERAAEVAFARLGDTLARGCVAPELLSALSRHGLDPFPDVASTLAAASCSRASLEPAGEVSPGGEAGAAAARATLERIGSPACRSAFAQLFGLSREARTGPSRDVVVSPGETPRVQPDGG